MVVRLCICRSRKEGDDSEQQYLLHALVRCRSLLHAVILQVFLKNLW
jgi:hypothetical protein